MGHGLSSALESTAGVESRHWASRRFRLVVIAVSSKVRNDCVVPEYGWVAI